MQQTNKDMPNPTTYIKRTAEFIRYLYLLYAWKNSWTNFLNFIKNKRAIVDVNNRRKKKQEIEEMF